MQITPNDIASIEEAGSMNGSTVKIIKTIGGFHVAVGKRKKNSQDEALAAGSHPAIVKYNLEKQYSEYQPDMKKSEGYTEPIVEKHSHYLSNDLRKSGHDIFSIQNGNMVEFQITKYNAKVGGAVGSIDQDHLVLDHLNMPKEFVQAMSGATLEKAVSCQVGLKIKK